MLPQDKATAFLLNYQSQLLGKGLCETTINRRLASLRAFLRFARAEGVTCVKDERIISTFPQPILKIEDLLSEEERLRLCIAPLQGNLRIAYGVHRLRDAALLSLLCEVPLHSSEIGALRLADFSFRQQQLILPGSPSNLIHLSTPTTTILERYLQRILRRKRAAETATVPLLGNFDRRVNHQQAGLVSKSVLEIVRIYGAQIGRKDLNPRLLRWTTIVRTLQETHGDMEKAAHRFPHISRGTWEYYAARIPGKLLRPG